jgi:hypothetical protein
VVSAHSIVVMVVLFRRTSVNFSIPSSQIAFPPSLIEVRWWRKGGQAERLLDGSQIGVGLEGFGELLCSNRTNIIEPQADW